MGNYVRNCTQTWVRVSKFAHAHDHVILTHEPMSVWSFEHNFPLLRLIRRVSWSVFLIVVVSRRSQLFFVVSRFSWMVFIFYGGYAHVFTETENRGQCLDKCTGWVEHV